MATSVKIDDDLKKRIQYLAEARHRSAHWIMREAIRDYVDREEKREAFKQDAIRAWEKYQEDGLHITGEEAREWLSSWGEDGANMDMPKCHK